VLIIDRRKLAQLCVNSALDCNFFGTRSTKWSALALACILKIVVQFVQSSGIWHSAVFGQLPGKRATEDLEEVLLYIWEKQTRENSGDWWPGLAEVLTIPVCESLRTEFRG
jgi:hypothetical protein